MNNIDYNHAQNLHSLAGPRAAFPIIFGPAMPKSFLDVGCGLGTWLKAAQEAGVTDFFGVDGINTAAGDFLVPKTYFQQQDLTQPWRLDRRFEAALCLEVAEHLDSQFAGNLIAALTWHADTIVFGAACPGQGGQHHVNCQWPAYWQNLFNAQGYVCADEIRWRIWEDTRIEPWYRQNMFIARRNPSAAGQEPRIQSVMHPDLVKTMIEEEDVQNAERIARGALPFKWYLSTFPQVVLKKVIAKFK